MAHRTPRAFRSEPIPHPNAAPDLPAVSPVLVEWLEREFPIELSPSGFMAEMTLKDQAEKRGRQQVIERLRSLSDNQE